MQFLYPWFLSALLVLAIPVIVHLFQFRKYKTIIFPSIAFLKNIDTESKNRNKLKHILVLIARCCALAALVIAFSLPSCGTMTANGSKLSVSIFIDNSFSMENRDNDGILFEKARQKAVEIVQSYGDNAEFQILSQRQNAAMHDFVTASEAMRMIDELKIDAGSLTLAHVFRMQQDIFSKAKYENKKSYIISDFQRGMFREKLPKLAKNVKLNCVQISSGNYSNVSIDSAWLGNPFAMSGEKNTLYFKLVNSSSSDVVGVSSRLVLDGKSTAAAVFDISKENFIQGQFEYIVPGSYTEAWIEIDDPGMTFDNRLYVNIAPSVRVNLQLNSTNQFVNSALKANSFVNVNQNNVLSEVDAVVFADFNGFSATQLDELYSFVMNGGISVVVPSMGASLQSFQLLTTKFGFPEVKKVDNVKIGILAESFKHPFFQSVFTSFPKLPQLPIVNEYYSSAGSAGGGQAVLSLENGDPLLIEQKIGKGKFYLFLNSLQMRSGNLVASSLFFPLITNTILPSNIHNQLYGIAASGKTLSLSGKYKAEDNDILIGKGTEEWIPEIQTGNSGSEIFLGSYFQQSGMYDLKRKKISKVLEKFALNYDRVESDIRSIDKGLQDKITSENSINWIEYKSIKSVSPSLVADSGLWRLFIWLAAAFFALEIILLMFGDRLLNRLIKNNS